MSVENALKSMFRKFAKHPRRTQRSSAATQSTETLESRALLTLIGANAIVSHTVQSVEQTAGIETPVGPTGTSIVVDAASDPEFRSFAGQYDIDIDAGTISMKFNFAVGTAPDPSRVIEAGTFDRYYFEFDLAANESIASVSSSASATLQPNVSASGNVVTVEIGPGMQIGNGFDALINVDIARSGTTITGHKFHDMNNDGDRDVGESFLNGFTVEIRDLNSNAILSTQTQDIDLNGDGIINPLTESGVYVFSDVDPGTWVVQENLPPGWAQTLPNSPDVFTAFDLDTEWELTTSGKDFLNWGGLQEKWFFGVDVDPSSTAAADTQWFYITPDGSIYQWDGSPQSALTGTLVTQLGTEYYDDPSLVYNAQTPRQYIADVDISNAKTFREFHFGNYLAPVEFDISLNQATNEATFNWSAVSGATYDVWISDVAAGEQIQLIPDLNGEDIPLTTVLPDRRYRAWIRANSTGATSGWSAPQDFEFFRDAVNLITSPQPTTIDATPTVEWQSLAGASSYDLRVTNGNQTVYSANDIVQLSHRVARQLQFGVEYQVAVRANFSDGSQTAWDAGLPIEINGTTKPFVSGNIVNWSQVPAATEYEIWVNRYDSAGSLLRSRAVSAKVVNVSTFTLPPLPTGDYAIWIRAIRAEGTQRYRSFWGPRTDFFVTDIDEPADDDSLAPQLASIVTNLEDKTNPADGTPRAPTEPTETGDARAIADSESTNDGLTTVMAELASSTMLDDSGRTL